jgi:Flavin containing amine oxidoreductase
MEEIDIPTLVVGGGLCGSYIGLQLLEQNYTSFLILEAVGMFRGKQKSIRSYPSLDKDPEILEMGSSVFHTEQDHLLGLLHFLELDSQIQLLDPQMKSFYTYPGMHPKEAKKVFLDLKKKIKEEAKKYPANGNPSSETINELATRILTKEEYNILSGCWPEWYEMKDQNAYSVSISEEYMGHWCKLQYGLEQILDRATDLLEDHFHWFQPVSRIEKLNDDQGYRVICSGENERVYRCKRLYLCCNLKSLQEEIELIGFTELPKYLELGTYLPCMRVYIVLKRDIATSLSNPIMIESLSGPPVENGWKCKYSIQVSPRVWLISYPDGTLVETMYSKLLSGELVDNWIDDMNHYFNLHITRDDIQDLPEVTVWGDAYSILNKKWYEPNAPNGIIQDETMITCLPTPYNQAWMEGHLYQIPGFYHHYCEQFVKILDEWIKSHGVSAIGPFLSCAIVPITKDGKVLLVKEKSGIRKGQTNPIGGKVRDKYFPNTQGALYAAFEELAEEGHFLISNTEALKEALLCIGSVTVNTSTNQKCLCIGIQWNETSDKLIEWWKSEQAIRDESDFLPAKWNEIEQLIPVTLDRKLNKETEHIALTEYPSLLLQFIQKYKNNIDMSKGLRLTDCKTITFNRLALPVAHI